MARWKSTLPSGLQDRNRCPWRWTSTQAWGIGARLCHRRLSSESFLRRGRHRKVSGGATWLDVQLSTFLRTPPGSVTAWASSVGRLHSWAVLSRRIVSFLEAGGSQVEVGISLPGFFEPS